MQLASRLRLVLSVFLVFTLLVPGASLILTSEPTQAQALTLSELQKKKAQEEQKAKEAAAAAAEQKRLAELAAEKKQQFASQINKLEGAISNTQGSIQATQAEIGQKGQEIAQLESELRKTQDQQDALLRQLYISYLSMPDALSFFSEDNLSQRQLQEAQFNALKKSVAQARDRTVVAKTAVEEHRSNLVQKSDKLQALQEQQTDQKRVMGVAKTNQEALQKDALGAAKRLDQEAAQARAAAAEIAKKIQILTATSNWGGQIISGSQTSWYYAQTGNYTRLGYSHSTVNDYGCYITSIAMVATYYGNQVSPTYLAQNAIFDYQGYLISLPGGLGVTRNAKQAVNWNVVADEVQNGRPVIVSIYLPSVGAVNSDGSSHFVVIYGQSDGKFLMMDPIGPGRGYNLNQVRSMVIMRQN